MQVTCLHIIVALLAVSKHDVACRPLPDCDVYCCLSIDWNKSPLQILAKVAVGTVRTLEIFHGTLILGASRGRLCDNSAFL